MNGKKQSCLTLSLSLSLSLSSCFICPFIHFPAAQSQPPWNHCHIRAFNWLWPALYWHSHPDRAIPLLINVNHVSSFFILQLSSQTTFKRAHKPNSQFLIHANPRPFFLKNRHIFRVVLYWALHRMFGTFKDGMAS